MVVSSVMPNSRKSVEGVKEPAVQSSSSHSQATLSTTSSTCSVCSTTSSAAAPSLMVATLDPAAIVAT